MTTLTIDFSQITQLAKNLSAPQAIDQVVRIVATSMQSELKNRIHEEGKAANDSDIGQYSTTPMYVGKNAVGGGKIKPIGKTGETVFQSGKKKDQPHKTQFFGQGYKEYKTYIGRNQLGKVNLSLSGQLNAQFVLIGIQNGWGLGWQDTEKYIRAMALEKKYGKPIWALTPEEEKKVQVIADYEIQRLANAIR